MPAGSWGANGDFSMWLSDQTAWTWERLWPLEERFWDAAPAAPPSPASPPPSLPPPTEQLAPVNITGSRPDDVQERRQSTAAKIVIGREEIDRFGDSTLGDVLRRLPGVTIQGRPGRGGAIRMRGLGNGYTQILLDGERVPPGFSIDAPAIPAAA